MPEIKSAIFARINKATDYRIANDSPGYNEVVVKSEEGELVLAIPREITLAMSVDLAKAEIARSVKEENGKKLHVLTLFEHTL